MELDRDKCCVACVSLGVAGITLVRKFAFSNRVVNDWNSLLSQCVNCCTVNGFKNVFQLNWNRKLLNYVSYFVIVGVLSAELEPETAKLC